MAIVRIEELQTALCLGTLRQNEKQDGTNPIERRQRSRTLGQAAPAHGAATIIPLLHRHRFHFSRFLLFSLCFPVAEPLCALRASTLVIYCPVVQTSSFAVLRSSLLLPQRDTPEAPGANLPRVSSSLFTNPLPRCLCDFCGSGHSRWFCCAFFCDSNWNFEGQWLQSAVTVIPVCTELRSLSYSTIAAHGSRLFFGSSRPLFELLPL